MSDSDGPLKAAPVEHRSVTDSGEIESMHDILSCWERRALLYYLQERSDPASLGDVAAHLAGWRGGNETPAEDETAVRETRRELRREHVRKMATFGALRYDARASTVELVDGMTVAVSEPWRDREPATLDRESIDGS
jgi:hypothetical protein